MLQLADPFVLHTWQHNATEGFSVYLRNTYGQLVFVARSMDEGSTWIHSTYIASYGYDSISALKKGLYPLINEDCVPIEEISQLELYLRFPGLSSAITNVLASN